MSDYRTTLDQTRERFPAPELSLEAVLRRRDRRRRDQRLRAGVVGLAIVLALILVGTNIIRSVPSVPTHRIPPVMHNGPLTYVTKSGIASVDPETGLASLLVRGSVRSYDWSPDGTELAYALGEPGSCSLWVTEVTSGERRRLTGCTARFASGQKVGQELDWSPDGTRIAFSGAGGVYTIGSNGTHEKQITEDSGGVPSWSGDGARIAYERGGSVYVMRADGSNPVALVEGDVPAWSPDGTKIAFLRDPLNPKVPADGDPYVLQVWTVDADGSHETKLGEQPGCCLGANPTLGWSPDGSKLTLTGVRFQVVQADGNGSRSVDQQGMQLAVRPSWRPIP
jgi:Tol biopolymer transport system component